MDENQKRILAHQLLTTFSKQKKECILVFTDIYQELFSLRHVPVQARVGDAVYINRLKAIDFLKRRFNLVSREEREQILSLLS